MQHTHQLLTQACSCIQVLSRKDQGQFWSRSHENYSYVSVDQLSKLFKSFQVGKNLIEELSKPYEKSQCHKHALSFNKYSLSKWELLKACMEREYLLMKRNSFIYIFKAAQVGSTLYVITITYNQKLR